MGGQAKTPKPQKSFVDPAQTPFLKDIREQAQSQFQAGSGVDIAGGVAPTLAFGQELLSGAGLSPSPYLTGAVEAAINPVQQRFQEQILPSITSAAEQAGAYGSSGLQDTRLRATKDFSREVSDIAAQLAYQNYAQERGIQTQIAPQMIQQALGMQQEAGFAPLREYASLVGGPTVLGAGSTAPGPSGASSFLSGALGGAGLGASLGSLGAAKGATGLAAVGGAPWLLGGAALGGLAGIL